MAHYKDFDKYDPRRYLVVLFAVERLKDRATLHYISQEVECTRAEAQRAIESGKKLYMVDVEKEGAVYRVKSWGILNKRAAMREISP